MRRPAWRATLVLLLAAAALGAVPLVHQIAPDAASDAVRGAMAGVSALGHWGALLFILLQIGIAISGVLPASLLGMAAGAVYGIAFGFAIAAAGTLAGAWLAFALARSLLRGRIERLLADRPRLRDLDARLGRETWKLVCLLRVSPVMPFAVTSYTLGLSSVAPRAYMLGSLAAMPALLGYVMLGSLAQAGLAAGQAGAGPFRWAMLGAGALATILLTARMGWLVKGALKATEATAADLRA